MNNVFNVPNEYDIKHIRSNGLVGRRMIPLLDKKIESLMLDLKTQQFDVFDQSIPIFNKNKTVDLYGSFVEKYSHAVKTTKLNKLSGFESFNRVDICAGCTQYLDDIYISFRKIQVLEQEYLYHERLDPNIIYKTIDSLEPNVPLIITLPFAANGFVHPQMDEILERCLQLNIPVHIDGAWLACSRDITFDFSHPAVESFGISMSKGYGTSGWNRIGLRWKKNSRVDSISITTDFFQTTAYTVAVGHYFLDNLEFDHLWNTHSERNLKVCQDFGLTQTNAIHAVVMDNESWGIAPLIRYLEYYE